MGWIIFLLSILPGFYSSTTAREIIGFDGGSIYIPCKYDLKYKAHVKYWCRGGQLDSCKILQRSNTTVGESENIIIRDKARGVFIVTMKKLKKADSSGYCCAIEIHGAQDEGICLHLSITDGKKNTFRITVYIIKTIVRQWNQLNRATDLNSFLLFKRLKQDPPSASCLNLSHMHCCGFSSSLVKYIWPIMSETETSKTYYIQILYTTCILLNR
ncbi:UNVERIFIED_CONTAM: hypothetical protein FKN15_062279 [Acipenser sinensis]